MYVNRNIFLNCFKLIQFDSNRSDLDLPSNFQSEVPHLATGDLWLWKAPPGHDLSGAQDQIVREAQPEFEIPKLTKQDLLNI